MATVQLHPLLRWNPQRWPFRSSPSNGSAAFSSFLTITCRHSGDGLVSCADAFKISLCEPLADRQQFATVFCARFRVRHFELFERIEDNSGYYQPSILLIVGGDDIPGRVMGTCRTEAFLIRLHVMLPKFPLRDIRKTEFPILVRLVNARQKTLSLFFL